MSRNIVDKTTGELKKVAGNVAPPTDSVTEGDMRPVTSNAVYDYLNNTVTVTRTSGETVKSFLNRVYAAIDLTKITANTKLETGTASVYPLSSHGSSGLYFSKGSVTFGSGDIAEQITQLRLHETNSHLKYVDFMTGAGTGSGSSVLWDMGDQTDSTTSGPSSITIHYR
jgi:hypothetical protein